MASGLEGNQPNTFMIEIRKAERKRSKLRIGMSGPSGSGKTYSALMVALGLANGWEKVLLIDTENGSGELYSHLGPYNVITLEAPFTPERYVEAIQAGEAAGMEVIVIDSVSHEWDGPGGVLEANERLAIAKFKGNTWAAWNESTPRHRRFIQAIVSSKCHIITTARSKTETVQGEDKKVKKLGMKEIQREGFEYELTANFNLDRDGNYAIASKDRTGLFINRDPFQLAEETGREFLAWNDAGAEVKVDVSKEKSKILHNLKRLGFILAGTKEEQAARVAGIVEALTGLTLDADETLPDVVKRLEVFKDSETAQAVYAEFLSKQSGEVVVIDEV